MAEIKKQKEIKFLNSEIEAVRKLPDVTSALVGTISKGTVIKNYIIVNNGWLQYTSTDGNTCYVSMKYLTKKVETTTVTNGKRNVAIKIFIASKMSL